jgi:nitrite reductase/ring-hydroxylating ferredoxin subunit
VPFELLARLSEIPEGSGLCVRRGELEIGLYRVEGRVYAMENVCPHAGYALHEGELAGSDVICPGHGWAFSVVTGLAPGEVEEEPLRRYPVRIEVDEVWVDLATPLDP